MDIGDIHGLAHKHLDERDRAELASWLLMEANTAPTDEYYGSWADEIERRNREERQEWNSGLLALKGAARQSL